MAIITGNIIVGDSKPKQKQNLRDSQKNVVKNFSEIRPATNNTSVQQPERFVRKNKQVIVEKRVKLTESKPDRKSAYVRDMTTV